MKTEKITEVNATLAALHAQAEHVRKRREQLQLEIDAARAAGKQASAEVKATIMRELRGLATAADVAKAQAAEAAAQRRFETAHAADELAAQTLATVNHEFGAAENQRRHAISALADESVKAIAREFAADAKLKARLAEAAALLMHANSMSDEFFLDRLWRDVQIDVLPPPEWPDVARAIAKARNELAS